MNFSSEAVHMGEDFQEIDLELDGHVNANAMIPVEWVGRAVAVIDADDGSVCRGRNLKCKAGCRTCKGGRYGLISANSVFPEVAGANLKDLLVRELHTTTKLIFGEGI